MSAATDPRTLGELLSDAVDQLSKLIRNEVAIARAELAAKAKQAGVGAGFLVGAALLITPTVVLLLLALASWLIELGLRASLSNLIAAMVGLVLSGLLASLGMARLSPDNLTPERTIKEIDRDVAAVKERTT
jgi:uncharacterized protein YacL